MKLGITAESTGNLMKTHLRTLHPCMHILIWLGTSLCASADAKLDFDNPEAVKAAFLGAQNHSSLVAVLGDGGITREHHPFKNKPYTGWGKDSFMQKSDRLKILIWWQDGIEQGPYAKWYEENGNMAEQGTLKAGKLDGPCTSWHLNGQKRAVNTYTNGIANGHTTNWHPNGQ